MLFELIVVEMFPQLCLSPHEVNLVDWAWSGKINRMVCRTPRQGVSIHTHWERDRKKRSVMAFIICKRKVLRTLRRAFVKDLTKNPWWLREREKPLGHQSDLLVEWWEECFFLVKVKWQLKDCQTTRIKIWSNGPGIMLKGNHLLYSEAWWWQHHAMDRRVRSKAKTNLPTSSVVPD